MLRYCIGRIVTLLVAKEEANLAEGQKRAHDIPDQYVGRRAPARFANEHSAVQDHDEYRSVRSGIVSYHPMTRIVKIQTCQIASRNARCNVQTAFWDSRLSNAIARRGLFGGCRVLEGGSFVCS